MNKLNKLIISENSVTLASSAMLSSCFFPVSVSRYSTQILDCAKITEWSHKIPYLAIKDNQLQTLGTFMYVSTSNKCMKIPRQNFNRLVKCQQRILKRSLMLRKWQKKLKGLHFVANCRPEMEMGQWVTWVRWVTIFGWVTWVMGHSQRPIDP